MTRFVDVDNSHTAPLDTESDHPQEQAFKVGNRTDSEKFTYASAEESLEEEQEEEMESESEKQSQ